VTVAADQGKSCGSQRRKLIIHLKTADALGVDARSALLATADEISNSSAMLFFGNLAK
jgi:hypothetical protein